MVARDVRHDTVRVIVLPVPQARPTLGFQPGHSVNVSFFGPSDLCGPKVVIRLGGCAVIGTAMPKAAVYENSQLLAGKGNVDCSSYFGDGPIVHAVAHSESK